MRYILPFLLLFSFNVQAEDYFWTFMGQGRFPSPQAACAGHGDQVSMVNPTYYNCISGGYLNGYSGRGGNMCPLGYTEDKSTGLCTPPDNKCAELKDTPIPAFRWSSNSDDPPSTVSVNGCAATISKARCSYVTTGKATCTGTATLTGEQKQTDPLGTAETCEGAACSAGAPQPEKENQECIYSSNGSGSSSCTAINTENNPGNSDCGTFNGEFKCIRNPKATSTTNKLESTKTEKSNTDGTVTTVKDNTLTTTKCVDKSCTTSTTNSKGTSTTDSNGNKTGESSTCTGANCNGKGETNGTGDSNKSDGDKAEEESEEEGDSPTTTPLEEPKQESLDGEGDAWDAKIDEKKTELKDAMAKIKESFSPVGELSIGGGGGQLYCPPPIQVAGANFDLCLAKFSNQLSWIGSAIYAVFAVIALLIIFN